VLASKELGKLASDYLKPPPLIPSLIPSILFWSIQCTWFIFSRPGCYPLTEWKSLTTEVQIILIVAGLGSIWITSIIFNTLEPNILRFFEGYHGPEWIWKLIGQGRTKQEASFDALKKEVSNLEPKIVEPAGPLSAEGLKVLKENRLKEVQFTHKLFSLYPPNRAELLPTEMGNIIRAGEAYSYQRYGIDAVLMWSLLCEVLPESSRKSLNVARQNLSFILFLCTSTIALMIQSLLVLLLVLFQNTLLPSQFTFPNTFLIPTLFLLFGSYAALLIFARCLNSPALIYADGIRRSFDLHRKKLLKALGVSESPKPCSKDERKIWKELNNFVLRGYFMS